VVETRVWAPQAGSVELVTRSGRRAMQPGPGGWWRVGGPALAHGEDYAFAIDGGEALPDPRSPRQPDGVLGFSRHVDHSKFEWQDNGWRGVPLPGRCLYEMHVGTFTEEGTFDGATKRLDHLCRLGVDAVEVMPIAAFDGRLGWGYDGVALYAVHEPYGGPDGFKRFVDAAHAAGLAVILDVVYNHLGPAGNVLPRYGPYFTDEHVTPWGPAVNLDTAGSDEVRRYVIENALGWVRDYHVDGLRLDAVHALADRRATHLLEEVATEVHALAARLGRHVFLIAESDRNDPRTVTPVEAGGLGLDAQWCDDVHHAIHAALTGERQGYYVDFGSLAVLAKSLTRGFVHDGDYSTFRGRRHGRPYPPHLSGHRLVAYTQTHDQVGNRAKGERTAALMSPGRLRIAATLVLTSAFTPMLFMGEEWAAGTPWRYFTSFSDAELGAAVSAGRRSEFAEHGWPAGEVPDPQDPRTARDSVLDWSELDAEPHAQMLDFYRRLLRLRREVPGLSDGRLQHVRVDYDEAAGWLVMYREGIAVVANISPARQAVPVAPPPTDVLLSSVHGFVFSEHAVEIDADSVAVVQLLAGAP
jgi:maltooligosyltrehalose trehalohydrolase